MNGLIFTISLLLAKFLILPFFIYFVSKDLILFVLKRQWKIFNGWGLHVYVGRFGAGKTCSMVRDAYRLAKKYKQLTILTNLKLMNFPKWTKIVPLHTAQDIINAPENTLVLIDEIGTIFNSRDFAKGKESVPKILFQHICQCRKRHLMIYATSQRWNFVDKQLRDIVATVRKTSCAFPHPFSRMATVLTYDAVDYDRAFTNPMLPLPLMGAKAYIQTDRLRNRYDTSELVETMLTAEYVSDEEILRNQGYDVSLNEVTRVGKRALKKTGRGL